MSALADPPSPIPRARGSMTFDRQEPRPHKSPVPLRSPGNVSRVLNLTPGDVVVIGRESSAEFLAAVCTVTPGGGVWLVWVDQRGEQMRLTSPRTVDGRRERIVRKASMSEAGLFAVVLWKIRQEEQEAA